MFGDTFGCHSWRGSLDTKRMEARDADKHPATLRTATCNIDSSDEEYQLLKFKSSALYHSVFENIYSFVAFISAHGEL